MRKTMIAVLACLFTMQGHAAILGYISGNDYLEFDDAGRVPWLIGAMDGIMAEAIMNNQDAVGPWLGICIEGISRRQLKAIFEKSLNDQPDAWHVPAALILHKTLTEFCEGRI